MPTTIGFHPEHSRIRTSIAQQDSRALASIPEARLRELEHRYGLDIKSFVSGFHLPDQYELGVLERMAENSKDTTSIYEELMKGVPAIQKRQVDPKLKSYIADRKYNMAEASQLFKMECLDKDLFTLGIRTDRELDIPVGVFPVLNVRYPLQSDLASANRATKDTAASRARKAEVEQSRKSPLRFSGSSPTQPRWNQSQRTGSQSKQSRQSNAASSLDQSQWNPTKSDTTQSRLSQLQKNQPGSTDATTKQSQRSAKPPWRP